MWHLYFSQESNQWQATTQWRVKNYTRRHSYRWGYIVVSKNEDGVWAHANVICVGYMWFCVRHIFNNAELEAAFQAFPDVCNDHYWVQWLASISSSRLAVSVSFLTVGGEWLAGVTPSTTGSILLTITGVRKFSFSNNELPELMWLAYWMEIIIELTKMLRQKVGRSVC